VNVTLRAGESADAGGLSISYASLDAVPSVLVQDLPLPESAGGGTGEAVAQMTNVVFGTTETSSGEYTESPEQRGEPALSLIGLQARPVTLDAGESVTIDGLEYTFEGQREFAGINVKRDRSDVLVWLGAAMIVVGLMITFWVPRRRLWAKITANSTALAGQAPSHANFTRELRDLAREAGAKLPEEYDDD
jgi:hypothetical protein